MVYYGILWSGEFNFPTVKILCVLYMHYNVGFTESVDIQISGMSG